MSINVINFLKKKSFNIMKLFLFRDTALKESVMKVCETFRVCRAQWLTGTRMYVMYVCSVEVQALTKM